jgi:hypothetical protein
MGTNPEHSPRTELPNHTTPEPIRLFYFKITVIKSDFTAVND